MSFHSDWCSAAATHQPVNSSLDEEVALNYVTANRTIVDIREAIRTDAQNLFGRELFITERAYQALEVTTRAGRTPNATHVWVALAKALPGITLFYDEIGADVESLRSKPWPTFVKRINLQQHDLSSFDWQRLFKDIFCIVGKDRKVLEYTLAGKTVRRTGIISPESLALGILQSGRVGIQGRATNLILRYMAKAAGLTKTIRWDDEVDTFSNKAVVTFQQLTLLDSSYSDQQFIIYHDGQKYRISPFGAFGGYQLQKSPLPDGSLWIARGNIIQPPTRFSLDAIMWLEKLINSDAKEKEFQDFFESNPEFLLVLGDYKRAHAQLILHEDIEGSLIPDFFLEKINSNFCDICDLKRPTAELVRRQRHRRRFRDTVMEAVAQLENYRDWFEDRERREFFHRMYGLNAYRPRVVVIIGRQRSYNDEVERIRLESNLPAWVRLKTYDDVLSRALHWREFSSM